MCNPFHKDVVRLYHIMRSGRAYLNSSEDDVDLDMEIMEELVSVDRHTLLSILNKDSDYLPYPNANSFSEWLEVNMKAYLKVRRKDLDTDNLILVVESC